MDRSTKQSDFSLSFFVYAIAASSDDCVLLARMTPHQNTIAMRERFLHQHWLRYMGEGGNQTSLFPANWGKDKKKNCIKYGLLKAKLHPKKGKLHLSAFSPFQCHMWHLLPFGGGGTWFSPQQTHLEVQPPPPSPAASPMRQHTREWLWSHKVSLTGDGGSTREPIEIMYLRWRHCWILGQVSVLIKVSSYSVRSCRLFFFSAGAPLSHKGGKGVYMHNVGIIDNAKDN